MCIVITKGITANILAKIIVVVRSNMTHNILIFYTSPHDIFHPLRAFSLIYLTFRDIPYSRNRMGLSPNRLFCLIVKFCKTQT